MSTSSASLAFRPVEISGLDAEGLTRALNYARQMRGQGSGFFGSGEPIRIGEAAVLARIVGITDLKGDSTVVVFQYFNIAPPGAQVTTSYVAAVLTGGTWAWFRETTTPQPMLDIKRQNRAAVAMLLTRMVVVEGLPEPEGWYVQVD